jgi:tRNA G46 methylase TrmB
LEVIREFKAELVPRPRGAALSVSLPSDRPLDIEIGCGAGWHPITYARQNPARTLVAIEHTVERLARHEPLPNLIAVHADAVSWITHHVSSRSVDRYLILYPNPRSNWTGAPFTSRLIETLKPGGRIQLATNLPELAARARRELSSGFGLELEIETAIGADSPGYPRTHFEKKYLLRGERCLELVFAKPARS